MKILRPTPAHVERVLQQQTVADCTHHFVKSIANMRGIGQRDAARRIVHSMLRWSLDFRQAKWIEYLASNDSGAPRRGHKQHADMMRKHRHWPIGREVQSKVDWPTGEQNMMTKGRVIKHDPAYGDRCLIEFSDCDNDKFTRVVAFRNLKPLYSKGVENESS